MTSHGRWRTGLALLASLWAPAAFAVNPGRVEYYHRDALGNVRVVTDESGQVIERHDYLPFGEECTIGACATNPGVGTGQPLKFTGKERDAETGLDYFVARYYGSKIGRFTTTDPVMTIQANLVDPQRWNRYAYARNNPLKYVDLDGRDVSIALNFTGVGWTAQDRSAVIGRVSRWYGEQGVGNVHVFDAATMAHGAWFASLRTGYADVEVSSSSGTKQSPDRVFAGNYAELPGEQRVNAISNAVIHETAAHQFHGTYAESIDQIAYSRGGNLAAADPQVRRRQGTVADSYAYSDEKTRSKVTSGPIPIDPADRQTLVGRVGPSVRVEPPVKK